MAVRLLKEAFLTVFPDGGQRVARRNARAALDTQRTTARERQEAYALLARPAREPRRVASG